MNVVFLVFLLNAQWSSVKSLNILGVFPYEGRSHFFVFEQYLQKLAERGHNLTVISHFPREDPISNYHDISLARNAKIVEDEFLMDRSVWTVLKIMDYLVSVGNKDCKLMLENQSVKELWRSETKFDLVVMETFNSDCALGLAYKLGAPVIGVTSADLMPWHYRTLGIPFNPPSVSSIFTGSFKPTLYDRLETSILDCIFCYKYWNGRKVDEKTLEDYLGKMPSLDELSREMKYLLLYRNFVLSGSKLLPSRVIEVGGYHVVPPKRLPDELLKFIDESEHGVIYVSFGSMLKESSLPQHKMEAILNALGELPQRIIWKWDGNATLGEPKKHYVANWLPQNDLLAHPKVVAFFSHCGLLSTTEAIYHGVPLVVMPVFEDQLLNAAGVTGSGLGVQVDLYELTKEKLLSKFRTVLDTAFRSRVKTISKAYSSRPVTAMENAIFWTEFAANYNLSLSNYAAEVPQHQSMCLELLALLLAVAAICSYLSMKVIVSILSVVRNLGSGKVKVKGS